MYNDEDKMRRVIGGNIKHDIDRDECEYLKVVVIVLLMIMMMDDNDDYNDG